ncbi:TetR/AcrR family transcriptional regulator [Mycolicibacterium sp. 22603]|uniref:TetR/AcrR family transcriptional regulator n=1 Tax=Mycolicibacterium sp. 22603 TaxID=3453950 RepID=UPI003F869F77
MPSDKERSSAGDPVRTLELLWRQRSGRSMRGPRQRMTVDQVVEAAIDIADDRGLGQVTIRAVAAALGAAPMAIYTYVPGKAELLDLMLDAVYQQMPRADLTGMPWRDRVSAIADENRAMLARHRWVVDLPTTRPPLGPGMMTKYEHELGAFDGLGLTDLEMDAALTHVLGFVDSVSRIAIAARAAAEDSGENDEQWWQRVGPLLDRVLDADRYPLAVRVGAVAGQTHHSAYDAAHAYDFGLARILDGFAVLIDRRGP